MSEPSDTVVNHIKPQRLDEPHTPIVRIEHQRSLDPTMRRRLVEYLTAMALRDAKE